MTEQTLQPIRRTSAPHRAVLAPTAVAILSLVFAAPAVADASSTIELKSLSLEDLMNIEVTSVSKTAAPLSAAPAAIYVITRDEILRSGARSIPDMLRLAPNLQVAQITSASFAITARGFNGSAASKLLVLIDGRSVYTPFYSGVSWDVQDVLPENIDRIEVISGPGATLWGPNAVNGVINIITRSTDDTAGASAVAGAGNLEQRASAQYIGRQGDSLTYRAYVDSFHYDHDVTATGENAMDAWRKTQGGFRMDWAGSQDRVTVQGDLYQGNEDEGPPPAKQVSGGNLLARWISTLAGGSALQVLTYFDYVAFSVPGSASDHLHTYDLEAQHSFAWGSKQSVVWGAGARAEMDDFQTALSSTQGVLVVSPQQRTLNVTDLFAQDTITLSQALRLVLGTKFEQDPYTGFEPLPSARLAWQLTEAQLLWLAVSRAVRAPSRVDRDFDEFAGPVQVIKGGDFQPERLVAYEVGYRAQPTPNTTLSISTFYNVYTDLRSVLPSTGGGLPISFANGMAGDTDGVEAWGTYRVNTWWRLTAGANWLHENLHFLPGASQIGGIALAGDDPSYQLSVGSAMDLARGWQWSMNLRRIAALPDPVSPAYTEADTRIGWSIQPALEISLTGFNLLHAHHLEFGTGSTPIQLGPTGAETGRSILLQLRSHF